MEIPQEYDPNLVQECREYNLHTSKTPKVAIKSELPEEVNEEKFVRGRSVVNPKSRNVKVKTFSTKNPKDKHQEVQIGEVKIIESDEANVGTGKLSDSGKRSNSDPCGSSKKIKLEITEPEKKTFSRGRPKSGNADDSHVFVKKELPDDLENTIYCTKCNTVFDNVKDLCVHEKGCYVCKRFKCKHPKCDKDFSQNSIMLQHYCSIHEGNPYKCTQCPKTFTFNKVLQNHIKVTHKSTKADFKYVCEVCSKGFDNHNHFQQHAD